MTRSPRPIETETGQEVFTQPVGGPSVAGEMRGQAAAWQGLADFGASLSEVGDRVIKDRLRTKGAEAVQRDPATGELSVQLRTPLSDLDAAYNHAAQASFLTQSESDRRLHLQQLAIDNMDDPDKFRQLATEYVKTQAGGKGVPTQLRGDLLNSGNEDIAQFTYNLVGQKRARDTKSQLDTIHSGITSTRNDIYALAHNGGTDTPAFQAAIGKLQNQYGALRNPVFGVSPEQIDGEIKETLSTAEGEATLGHALSEAKTNGAQAGLEFLDKAIWNEGLNLTPAQRETFRSRGRREIGEWDALQRDASTQLKQQVLSRLDDARAKADATGDWPSVVTPNEIATAFKDDPAKASDLISELNGRGTASSMRKQVANASPAELAAMDAQLNPANNPQGDKPNFDQFYTGFVAGHEGGYTPSDGNGHPANFGINQGANPDIDVKNLTQSEAKQILHDRYWVASGADNLPPALAAVQGDTAINMGVGAANELLQQSGGDPNKYLDLRAARYKAIADANPDKKADLPSWLTRNEDLRNFVRGVGFADRERTYAAFQQAVQARNQALTKDPAGYVASARPDIGAALNSDDPQAIQLGIRSSLQAQRDMGVNAPRIFADGQAGAIVQQFNNPPDPAKRADNMLQIIGSLQDRLGSYFPQAMMELQKKGMPTEAIALAQVKDDPGVAWRMASAVNAGRATLRKVAPMPEEIDKAVTQGLAPFMKTLAGQTGSAQVAAQQTEAVQLYAYQLAQEGVSDPGARAVRDVIAKHYTFSDSYRVPNGIDADAVQTGARQLLRELPATAIMPEHSIDPRLNAEVRQTMSSQILHGRGVWLTMPDDSGLYLAYPQETGFVPARGTNGRTISFPWAQLTQAAGRDNIARMAVTK